MTTRDKFSQAFALMMGDAIKIVVKKASTRVDSPPKRKHVQTLSQYLSNPRANIPYLVDCLSIRFRKPCWLISMKALLTTQLLVYSENENFIKHISSRSMLFDLSGYIDRSSLKSVEKSVYVSKYAKFLMTKCEVYKVLGRDVSKCTESTDILKLENVPKIFDEIRALVSLLRAAYANDVDFSSTSPVIHTIHIFLLKECLRTFTAYNRRVIFLLENLKELEAKDASFLVDIYKELCELHLPLQNIVEMAANKGVEGVKGMNLSKPSSELTPSIEEYVKNIIRARGSRLLQEKWNVEPNDQIKSMVPVMSNRVKSIEFDPFIEMQNIERRCDPSGYSVGEDDFFSSGYYNFQRNNANIPRGPLQNAALPYTANPQIEYRRSNSEDMFSPVTSPTDSSRSPNQVNRPQDFQRDSKILDLDQLLLDNISFNPPQTNSSFDWASNTSSRNVDESDQKKSNQKSTNPFK